MEETPNLLAKIAEDECRTKGNTVVSFSTGSLKEVLNQNDGGLVISFFEEKGIPNLNLEKNYDFTELKTLAFTVQEPAADISEVSGEPGVEHEELAEEVEKDKIKI